MKTIEISTASRPLADYAQLDNFLVLTSNSNPVAAIVSLKNLDPESVALNTNAEFLELIERARRECATGQTIPLAAMKRQLGV